MKQDDSKHCEDRQKWADDDPYDMLPPDWKYSSRAPASGKGWRAGRWPLRVFGLLFLVLVLICIARGCTPP